MKEEKPVYYTERKQLLRCYDAQKRPYAFRAENTEDFFKWKKQSREMLRDIMGFSLLEPCCPAFRKTGESRQNGFRRIKGILQTEPEIFMPLYLLVPDGLKEGEKRPCVIAPHGHGAGGKDSVAGVLENPAVRGAAEKYNCACGVDFVKQGYVVFCPDARGSGERREPRQQGSEAEKVLSSSCDALNFAAVSLGGSLAGMWTWDLMRLIDFAQSLPFCDGSRVACCGFSGGGLQTLWLAALDDRVTCAVISGYFHGYRDSILSTNFCGCNFVPHLWQNMDLCDVAALIAPRPFLIESGSRDELNGARGLRDVDEQFARLQKAYRLFSRQDFLHHFVFDGVHRWNGSETGAFLKRYLE
jgi:dienelactone hydrolase